MKMLLALAAAWAGAPTVGAAPATVPPTYAGSPNRGRSDASLTITNFAALDSGRDRPEAPRAGVRLARAEGPAGPGKGSGGRQAIYGHNGSDLIIGGAVKTGGDGSKGKGGRAAIYSTTIVDVPDRLPCSPAVSGNKAASKGPAGCGPAAAVTAKGPNGKATGQRVIIYNGTITSEPTNTLAGKGAGGNPGVTRGYNKPEPVIIYNKTITAEPTNAARCAGTGGHPGAGGVSLAGGKARAGGCDPKAAASTVRGAGAKPPGRMAASYYLDNSSGSGSYNGSKCKTAGSNGSPACAPVRAGSNGLAAPAAAGRSATPTPLQPKGSK